MLIPHKHSLKNRLIRQIAVLFSMMILMSSAVIAQSTMPAEIKIDAKMQLEIIDSVSSGLNRYYIFPDVADEMEKKLREQYKNDAYKDIGTLSEFCQILSEDIISVSNDRHLGIRSFDDEELHRICNPEPTEEDIAREIEQYKFDNYGFRKIERLQGNIGYLGLNSFINTEHSASTAIAAMNFLAHCDALIIDLRSNGGGSPTLIQLISSYFFDDPVHLNSFYSRETDSIKQTWTHEHVSGKKMTDALVYILTSNYTFSAAEEFTYNLKNLKRATVVGETTGGGAHPVMSVCFENLNFAMRVSFERAINPITGTNWEGVGVKPHIEVNQEDALEYAYKDALKKLKDTETDESKLHALTWVYEGLEAKLNPVKLSEEILQNYIGKYGPRTISYEEGDLYYQREGNPKVKMLPMNETLFWFEDIDFFRLEVELDSEGNPTALIGHYESGRMDKSKKD